MNSVDEWKQILVEAEIFMLPTEMSGRTSGITSGYRPNHNFGEAHNSEMRMGEIIVNGDEWINPGETKKVMVHFAMPQDYLFDLVPGLTWRIQEGSRHVGNGTVLYVMDENS